MSDSTPSFPKKFQRLQYQKCPFTFGIQNSEDDYDDLGLMILISDRSKVIFLVTDQVGLSWYELDGDKHFNLPSPFELSQSSNPEIYDNENIRIPTRATGIERLETRLIHEHDQLNVSVQGMAKVPKLSRCNQCRQPTCTCVTPVNNDSVSHIILRLADVVVHYRTSTSHIDSEMAERAYRCLKLYRYHSKSFCQYMVCQRVDQTTKQELLVCMANLVDLEMC